MSDNPVGDWTVTDPNAPAHCGIVMSAVEHMKAWVMAELAKLGPVTMMQPSPTLDVLPEQPAPEAPIMGIPENTNEPTP